MGKPVNIDEARFQAEVLDAAGVVVVDFWATWCGPCRALDPQLVKLADARPDIKVVKVDVDHNPGLASRYGIMSIPTLLFFRGGELRGQLSGVVPHARIAAEADAV